MTIKLNKIVSAVLVAIMISITFFQTGVALENPRLPQEKREPERGYNPETGRLAFIGGETPIAVQGVSGIRAMSSENRAMEMARVYAPEFGLQNPSQELQLTSRRAAGSDRSVVRYQQTYQGIPVLAGELIVNMSDNGYLLSMSGEVSPELSLDIIPSISAVEASQAALGAIAKYYQMESSSLTATEPELWIFDESLLKSSMRSPELVWRMDVSAADVGQPIREMVLINARAGGISLHFNQVDTFWSGSENKNEQQQTSATWYVSTSGNDANDCLSPATACATINAAITKAADEDLVFVAEGTYGPKISVLKSLTFRGGWDNTFSTQIGLSTLDGNGLTNGSVLYIGGGRKAIIERFKIQNGGNGGVSFSGSVEIRQSVITGNHTYPSTPGGGISFSGNLLLVNSTVSGNTAGGGGGIYSSSTSSSLTILNSIITNNLAEYDGGGISVVSSASTTIANSIIAGNTANRSYADCWGNDNITSLGNNIIGDSTGCDFTPQSGDLIDVDPMLGALLDDGHHPLHPDSPAIDAGNLAAPGSGGAACEAVDQFGRTRPIDGDGDTIAICDIGSYEADPPAPPVVTSVEVFSGSPQSTVVSSDFNNHLVAVVKDQYGVPVTGIDVTFTAPISGASGIFSDTSSHQTMVTSDGNGMATAPVYTANTVGGSYIVEAIAAEATIAADFQMRNYLPWRVSTTGDDANDCQTNSTPCATINGAIGKAFSGDIILVEQGRYTSATDPVVTISKELTILGGWDSNFDTQIGFATIDGENIRRGVRNLATSTLDHFIVENGFSADGDGGGIYGGNLSLSNSIVRNNAAEDGGGISGGSFHIKNSTISGNTATVGHGGGIYSRNTLILENSTIANNIAAHSGGGIHFEDGSVSDSTIVYNTAGFGGGIYFYGSTNVTKTIKNVILARNTGWQSNGGSDCHGKIDAAENYIIGNAFRCDIYNGSGNLFYGDPLIYPIAVGAPSYYPLLSNSRAIDAVNPSTCTSTDQRGISRPQGSACDIGAFEYAGTGTTPDQQYIYQGSPQNIYLDSITSTNFAVVVLDNDSNAVPGINVTFTAPVAAPSGIFNDSGTNITMAITDENGIATASDFNADTTLGSYIIQASADGLTPALSFNVANTTAEIVTYTMNHNGDVNNLPGQFLCNETQPDCTSGTNPDADLVHKYAFDTYFYYLNQHNHHSVDDANMRIVSSVQFGTNYQNAFWNGSQMVYGDNMVADDVAAHEITHGVTQYESGLLYLYQSGAINESFSDLWGEFVDQTNGAGNDASGVKWLMGEDLSIGAIRDMSNPPAFGHPDKISSSNFHTGMGDNGGVHINSGVNNKAVYLMTDGDSFNGKTITGIGLDKTAAIYYEVQTNLLGAGANYTDLYYALNQACQSLVGGAEGITTGDCIQVKNATIAVEMNIKPAQAYTPIPDACPAGLVDVSLFFDNLESGSSNWVGGSLTGSNNWGFASPGIASPENSLFGPNLSSINDSYASMAADVSLPAGSNYRLYYKHLFDLEGYYDANGNLVAGYDGGVLEYSTTQGSNWNDARSLLSDGQDYTTTLDSNYGNPLGGRAAFSGTSHGMVGSLYDLSSFAGQSIRFRWRIGSDNQSNFTGWFVDDIKIYECILVPNVSSITRADANPTNAASVDFIVIFSEAVTGVDTSTPFNDFTLTTTGVSGASISSVVDTGDQTVPPQVKMEKWT